MKNAKTSLWTLCGSWILNGKRLEFQPRHILYWLREWWKYGIPDFCIAHLGYLRIRVMDKLVRICKLTCHFISVYIKNRVRSSSMTWWLQNYPTTSHFEKFFQSTNLFRNTFKFTYYAIHFQMMLFSNFFYRKVDLFSFYSTSKRQFT